MELDIDIFASLSISVLGVLVHLSFIFSCCAPLRSDLRSTRVSIATTTNQVFYLRFLLVSMAVVRTHPPSCVFLIAPVS